jgi:hypothetical protein
MAYRSLSIAVIWSDLVTGLKATLGDRVVRLLLGLTLLVQIFAFSYDSLMLPSPNRPCTSARPGSAL